MQIALVSTHPPGKGSLNEYAYHFVRYLRTKPEVDSVVLLVDELPDGSTYPPAQPKTDNLAGLEYIPCWRFDALDNALRIRDAVKRTQPDIVLFNIQFASFGGGRVSAALGLLAPLFVKRAGYVTTVLLHNIMETVELDKAGFGGNPLVRWSTRAFGSLFTWFLLQADLVALTIPKYVEIIEQKYKSENVFLAPHGAFDEMPEPQGALPDGPMKIMTFGKFGTYKKVEALIHAYEIIRAKGELDVELMIAGTNNPNTPGYLERVKEQYAHIPNIHFTGYVAEQDVPRIFLESAVVVFPYNSTTGSSGVLHQAGSYGKAAVLPRLGDLAELIAEEGYAGEFFEPENANSMATAIECVLSNPQHRRDIELRNYRASQGVPIADVVDWYLLHFEVLLQAEGTQ